MRWNGDLAMIALAEQVEAIRSLFDQAEDCRMPPCNWYPAWAPGYPRRHPVRPLGVHADGRGQEPRPAAHFFDESRARRHGRWKWRPRVALHPTGDDGSTFRAAVPSEGAAALSSCRRRTEGSTSSSTVERSRVEGEDEGSQLVGWGMLRYRLHQESGCRLRVGLVGRLRSRGDHARPRRRASTTRSSRGTTAWRWSSATAPTR